MRSPIKTNVYYSTEFAQKIKARFSRLLQHPAGGMQGWVNLVGWLHTMTRPKTVTHPSTNRAQCTVTSFMRRTTLATTPSRQHKNIKRSLAQVVSYNDFHDLHRRIKRYNKMTVCQLPRILLAHYRRWLLCL